ncbi:MAG: hypothetical protein KFF73_02110, partial [Cyclobacteriaceae bacterium]|nr:hypothetical protein [Cyclobacteriaceae bacterium]
MNNIIVYCEMEDGQLADVSLELLTKGKSLARELRVQLQAVVIGSALNQIEKQIFPYGVDHLYVADAPELYPYRTLP